MKILAVDLAAQTGAAFGSPSQTPIAWPVDFSKVRDAARLSKVIRWTRHMHDTLAPDLIAIEAPIGGKDANAMLIKMVGCIEAQAHDLRIRTVLYAAATVRHHFIGKALTSRHFPGMSQAAAKIEIKKRVADRCRALGWEVKSLDCADALALFDYAASRESMSHQMQTVGGLFGNQETEVRV